MIIFLILGIVLVICCAGWFFFGRYSLPGIFSEISAFVCVVVIFIMGVSILGERMSFPANIQRLEAMKSTLTEMRKTKSIENAAMQTKIAEWNQWIAGKKYWNETVFDLWIPDEINEVEFLK